MNNKEISIDARHHLYADRWIPAVKEMSNE